MKHSHSLIAFTLGAFAIGLTSASAQNALDRPAEKPIVLTPPARHDGSNWSRAPLPASRPMDDLKRPDGQAIDQSLPPNTPASNTEPVLPPPRVAILQPTPPINQSIGIGAEPGLLPTGRTSVAVSANLDSATVAQSIRSATAANREQVLSDIESRMAASDRVVSTAHANLSADAKAKAKALKKSVKEARKDWDASNAQLAADYEAYAAAMGRVDANVPAN